MLRACRLAVRKREKRLRAFWRHEQFSIKMAAVKMSHHSSQRKAAPCVDVATQTLVENFSRRRDLRGDRYTYASDI